MSHTKTNPLSLSICSPMARRVRSPVREEQSADYEEQLRRADALLEEWHAWSATYRPALGMPGCSPSSRQAQSSKQWQSTTEIAEESTRKMEMETVEWCVDALDFPYRNAIGIEMRNRGCGIKVWRGRSAGSYEDALQAVLPLMVKKSLVEL